MTLLSYHTRANLEIQLLFCDFKKKRAEKCTKIKRNFIENAELEKIYQKEK